MNRHAVDRIARQTEARIAIATVAIAVALIVVKAHPSLGVSAIVALLVLPYWVPTIVAFSRRHPSRLGIATLNGFLGWTLIGWVASLAWSLSDNTGGGAAVVVNTTLNTAAHPHPEE